MLIEKDETVIVRDRRKGIFLAVAYETFDTDEKEFYPLITLETVYGMTDWWDKGDKIPVRKDLCKIEEREK